MKPRIYKDDEWWVVSYKLRYYCADWDHAITVAKNLVTTGKPGGTYFKSHSVKRLRST